MDKNLSWHHFVSWNRVFGFWGQLVALPLAAGGAYNAALISAGKAASTSQNWTIVGGMLVVGALMFLIGLVSSWRATSGQTVTQQTVSKAGDLPTADVLYGMLQLRMRQDAADMILGKVVGK